MLMARRKRPSPDYSRRGAYIDHLNRWVWTVDEFGNESEYRMVMPGEDAELVAHEMEDEMERLRPTPSSAFVPRLNRPPYLRLT